MFSSRGTVRYEERGQGYRDVEKVGKHWPRVTCCVLTTPGAVSVYQCYEGMTEPHLKG